MYMYFIQCTCTFSIQMKIKLDTCIERCLHDCLPSLRIWIVCKEENMGKHLKAAMEAGERRKGGEGTKDK